MHCVNFESQLDVNQKGIWRFRRFFNTEVAADFRLTLREGRTPLEPVVCGAQRIWLKREDLNPHGSHKDRSLAYQVSLASQRGAKELVISSSGNAAIAAAAYCRLAKIKLWAFLAPSIPRQKFLAVKELGATIVLSRRAMRLANYLAQKKKLENLRPSINDRSIEGFQTLGFELFEQAEKILPIFTYVTSGSSLIGLAQAFQKLKTAGCLEVSPRLNAVHSQALVAAGPKAFDESGTSLAGTGGIRRTRRAGQIAAALKFSGGRSWLISETDILKAARFLSQRNIKTSFEGCASLAAVWASGVPEAICILTGRFYEVVKISAADKLGISEAADLPDIDKIIFHA